MQHNEYQYEEMVLELREAVRMRRLTMTSRIQIMRDTQIKFNGANPILEWYYDREGMAALASAVLDEVDEAGSVLVSVEGKGARLSGCWTSPSTLRICPIWRRLPWPRPFGRWKRRCGRDRRGNFMAGAPMTPVLFFY